ncbi:MAG: hypothetical protein M3T55_06295 [Pseudomonadota bacterium]|nr:hypothetical protein [Pseudomonadota bacterium]
MRTIILVAASALALTACDRRGGARSAPPAATPSGPISVSPAQPPARRSGLWEQSMTRDGAAPAMVGKMRVCIDAASEAKLSVFGGKAGKSLCRHRSVARGPDGAYAFTSTCDMGEAGVMRSTGTLTGDLSAHYRVHDESDTTGAEIAPMNGRHITDIDATWLGPCPASMEGGDVILANGMKVNLKKLGAAAQAMGGGG